MLIKFWDLNTLSLEILISMTHRHYLVSDGPSSYGGQKGPIQTKQQNAKKKSKHQQIKVRNAKKKPNIKLATATQRKRHLTNKMEYRKQKSITQRKKYNANRKALRIQKVCVFFVDALWFFVCVMLFCLRYSILFARCSFRRVMLFSLRYAFKFVDVLFSLRYAFKFANVLNLFLRFLFFCLCWATVNFHSFERH